MTKSESEQAIRSLCHTWAAEQPIAGLVRPSFSAFKTWLDQNHYSHYLRFKSRAGPLFDAEMWFDAELRDVRLRAATMDLADILKQLDAAASPATRASVSLREVVMRLESHTATNDEIDAVRKLKAAGPDADAPLIGYVRNVFAKRCTGLDGWPMSC